MKLILKNLAIEYLDDGNGPIALLLHGWQDNLHTFDPLAQELQDWRLVRLDLPGFGRSELPPDTWDLDDYVDLVVAFINKLNLKPNVIIGHSFGGRITIKGTADAKFTPEKIVLIASAGVAKSNTIRNRVLKLVAKVGKVITLIPPLIFWRKQLREKLYRRTGSDYLSAGTLKSVFLRVIQEDLTSATAKINCPTLLIWGEDDTETPIEEARVLAGLIKNSALKILPAAGHFVHKDEPREVIKLIKGFV